MTPPVVRPRHLFLHNKKYTIRYGVPAGVMMAKAMEDPLLSPYAKARLILSIFYPRPVPPQMHNPALESALAFFLARSSLETHPLPPNPPAAPQSPLVHDHDHVHDHDQPPLFSLWQDLPVICASFRAVYGFHPVQTHLHWWDFLTLMTSMPVDSPFFQLLLRRQSSAAQTEPPSPEAQRVLALLRQGLPLDADDVSNTPHLHMHRG